jgi:hypothetical protein
MFTGEFPYDISGPAVKVLENIQHAEPTRPRKIISKFDSDVETILLKALEKDPGRRYQSAAGLRHDIQCWLDGFPIAARSISSLYALREIEVDDNNNVYVINVSHHNESDILWKYDCNGTMKKYLPLGNEESDILYSPAPIGMCVSDITDTLYLSRALSSPEAGSTVVYGLSTKILGLERIFTINGMGHVTSITEDPVTGTLWVVGFSMDEIPLYPDPTAEPFYKPYLAKIPLGSDTVQATCISESDFYDLALPMSIVWTGTHNECYTGPYFDEWLDVGKPACWCSSNNPRQCHGDADGISQGKNKYWVSICDIDVLIAGWNKSFVQIEGQTLGEVPLTCADSDHLPQGKKKYRISINDMDILIANWNISNKPDPNCP